MIGEICLGRISVVDVIVVVYSMHVLFPIEIHASCLIVGDNEEMISTIGVIVRYHREICYRGGVVSSHSLMP